MDESLQTFLRKAAAHRLLTSVEEKELGRRWQAGDREARNELVLCNIRLVVSVARYYRNRGLTMDEVVQEGIIGLNRAAEKFDPDRDIRFSTYATLWIKQAIQRGLQKGGAPIRLPSTVAGIRVKVRGYHIKNPDATVQEIADSLDLDEKDVLLALGMGFQKADGTWDYSAEVITSLDRVILSDDHTHTMLDGMADEFAPDPADVVKDDFTDELAAALDALDVYSRREAKRLGKPRQHRRVIEMHFGLKGKRPMPLLEISKRLGYTGSSPNTVKALLAEGIEFLGHRLGHVDPKALEAALAAWQARIDNPV